MDIIFSLIFLLILSSFVVAGLSMAPWVPTKKSDIFRFLEILELWEGEKFLEIGAWDARVSAAVAQKHPHNTIMWIEISFPIFITAYLRKIFFGPKNMKLKLANAFKEDFWNYDVIYVFGMPDKLSAKIIPKFMSEAKSGTKLYSYIFSIPEIYEAQSISYGGENEAKIHVLEK